MFRSQPPLLWELVLRAWNAAPARMCVCVWSRERPCRGRLVTAGDMLEVQDCAPCPPTLILVWGPHWTGCRIRDQACSWEVTVSENRDRGLGPGAGGQLCRSGSLGPASL